MRIAVVGSGISGLGAAYVLARAHDVEVFERADYAGGHTRTIRRAGQALDTGFLVHNERNYPLLGRLLDELGVATQPSEMSFSVSCGCGLEYSGRRPFAQLRRSADPAFLALAWEIGRWLRIARRSLDRLDCERWPLRRLVDELGFSARFRRHFLVPLTAALWSTAPGRALDFPAAYAVRFFDNHGMLGLGRRFAWRYVVGGSDTYVARLRERLPVRVGLGVRSLTRHLDGVELVTDDGEARSFDRVVVAAHADQALALLADPSDEERRVLGAIAYAPNEVVLHTDASFLPRAPRARASWNYRVGDEDRATVTYSLNRLQSLRSETEYCVTLNEVVPEEHVLDRATLWHPQYTLDSLDAQRRLPALSGRRHTFYAGAYHGNGFHEDGLASGIRAAELLGVRW